MKVSGLCGLFLVVGAVFMFFNFLSTPPTFASSWFPDFVATSCGDKLTLTSVMSRKLKENGRSMMRSNNKADMTLDDYHPITPVPVPAGGESFVHAPVQHGTPLNPYIPKPPPPSNPE